MIILEEVDGKIQVNEPSKLGHQTVATKTKGRQKKEEANGEENGELSHISDLKSGAWH